MKWFKESIKSLSNNGALKKICKIANMVLYALAVLFVLVVLGMLSNTSSQIQNNIYPFANDVLSMENSITFLFLCVFISSLFINKKIMIIVWIVAFFQLSQMFMKIPELKKVREIERCLDVNCYENR